MSVPGAPQGHDDPLDVAARAASLARPLLVGLDLDGVLAPIVSHPRDSRLSDGVAESLSALVDAPDVETAIISGRALQDLQTFDLPDGLRLIGSHGLESDEHAGADLDDHETSRLARLHTIATEVAAPVDGAWVEVKPASVVLHTYQAARDAALETTTLVIERARDVDGVKIKRGHEVVELMTRAGDKGRALSELRHRTGVAASVFVGDDVTDEDAFRVLGHDDLSIKVGAGPTVASSRLADPTAVAVFLQVLVDAVTGPG